MKERGGGRQGGQEALIEGPQSGGSSLSVGVSYQKLQGHGARKKGEGNFNEKGGRPVRSGESSNEKKKKRCLRGGGFSSASSKR